MGSRAGGNGGDLWSEIIAAEKEENRNQARQPEEIAVVYQRKKSNNLHEDVVPKQSNMRNANRLSLAPTKRVSWNRSLSTRGRTSIAVSSCEDYLPQQRKPKRKTKPAIPKGKVVGPPNYEKERAYFQEVDSFELLEESPSPNKFGTWTMGVHNDDNAISHLSSVLSKWLLSKKQNYSYGLSGSLSRILETPATKSESICHDDIDSLSLETPKNSSLQSRSSLHSVQTRFIGEEVLERPISSENKNNEVQFIDNDGCEDIEVAVGKQSLISRPGSLDGFWDPFLALLTVCEQSAPSKLYDVFSREKERVVKVGEGTFGEAFRAGKNVCKIVPFGGTIRVNGEVQKRAEELLEEVVLSRTLNHLRGHQGHVQNACSTFIETKHLFVCQGPYDAVLLRAWEDWDVKHGSENDHPKEFPEDQCYVVFVQEHGGQDLESFVLLNFDEARSLLVQITYALAVAEAAYEFEHRDLHWGNVLLSRKDSATVQFTLDGRQMFVRTFGLFISIIDFTLSRINTGEDILFLDLSLDPELFEGPKGDKQADTYRKMKDVTEECWEGSFPKTNVLWLQYLVDILLLKKSYIRTSKDERDLRSLKKRLSNYGSAKEAVLDPFFGDLLVDHPSEAEKLGTHSQRRRDV